MHYMLPFLPIHKALTHFLSFGLRMPVDFVIFLVYYIIKKNNILYYKINIECQCMTSLYTCIFV